MTFNEYFSTGCDNYHSEFIFYSGQIKSGVITQFFPNQPTEFYLIKTVDLIKSKQLLDAKNYEDLTKIATKVDLGDLKSAIRIY